MAAVEWEVGPKEEVIQALMESLVDPRLPLRVVSGDKPPSVDAQKSIAKQMHAVVLLYNYYHRKQNPDLEFLDFAPFCKLALSLRPSLISFMKISNKSERMEELDYADSPISVTEKAIRDACDIAMALDASKDVPTLEGYRISKVAVLLIDSKEENCLLQFGTVTEGVWSLMEKEVVNASNANQETTLADEKGGKKRKRNGRIDGDSKFLQLGYDVVKDVTGMDSSELVVLETHVAYSLSKEKSAAQFYMMQCPRSFSANQSIPLKFLVESLKGPLAEKDYDSWRTTELVNYYHLLPYVGFISCWLSREDLCSPGSNGYSAQSNMGGGKQELTQRRSPSSPLSKYSGEDSDRIDDNSSERKAISSVRKTGNDNREDNQKRHTRSSSSKVAKRVLSAKKEPSVVILEDLDGSEKHNTASLSGRRTRRSSCRIGNDDKTMEKSDKGCEILCSSKNEDRGLSRETPMNETMSKKLNKRCDAPNLDDFVDNDDYRNLDGLSSGEKTSEKMDSKIRPYHHRRNNISSARHAARGPEDDVNLKMADPLKSNDARSKDDKATGDNGDATISCDQTGIAVADNPLLASEDLQNALALLYRKRQELFSQICTMEDALALCEDNIERIRDGCEVDLARRCIKSIVSGNNRSLLKNETRVHDKDHLPGEDQCNPQSQKQTILSDIFLPGRSSCQDLEYICFKNNWRLPRYFPEPSHGKFLSNVTVESKSFKLSSEGECESSPGEARESAAAQMIAKLMKVCVMKNDQS